MQTTLIEPEEEWDKIVRTEKTLMEYIRWFIENRAVHHEATAPIILKSLEERGLKHPDFKINPRSIGRRMAEYPNSLHPLFQGEKKYDPHTQQDRVVWRVTDA